MKNVFKIITDKINSIQFSIVFVIYFALSMIPSISGHLLFSNNFLLGTVSNIYKFVILAFFLGFVLIRYFKNRQANKTANNNYNLFVVAFAAISLIIQLIVIFLSPASSLVHSAYSDSVFEVTISLSTKLLSFARFFSCSIYIVILLLVLKSNILDYNQISKIARCVILISLASLVYFFIENLHIFISDKELFPMTLDSSASFFDSKNSFGKILFFGVFFSLLSMYLEKKRIYILTSFVFLGILLFIKCQTAFILSMLLMIAAFLYYVFNIKSRYKTIYLSIIIAFVLFAIVAFVLFVSIPSLYTDPSLNKIYEKIISIFDTESMKSRFEIWYIYFNYIIGPINSLVGYGYSIGNHYLLAYTSGAPLLMYTHNSFHNGFLQVFADGGLFLLLLYICILAYSLKLIIRINQKNLKYIMIAFFISFILYSFSESVSLVNSAYETSVFGFIILTIPLILEKHERKCKDNREFLVLEI